jgi:hypothetical protein
MTRVAQFMVPVLFTLNKKYFVNDKYTTRLVDPFPLLPRDFTASLAQILSHPGGTTAELHRSSRLLTSLWREIVGLASGLYKPRYDLSDTLFGNEKAGSK